MFSRESLQSQWQRRRHRSPDLCMAAVSTLVRSDSPLPPPALDTL